jgi:hypothetical protein
MDDPPGRFGGIDGDVDRRRFLGRSGRGVRHCHDYHGEGAKREKEEPAQARGGGHE